MLYWLTDNRFVKGHSYVIREWRRTAVCMLSTAHRPATLFERGDLSPRGTRAEWRLSTASRERGGDMSPEAHRPPQVNLRTDYNLPQRFNVTLASQQKVYRVKCKTKAGQQAHRRLGRFSICEGEFKFMIALLAEQAIRLSNFKAMLHCFGQFTNLPSPPELSN